MIKVLIIDDHPVVIEGLTRALQSHAELEIVAHTATAEDAFDIVAELAIDVILLDINLPGTDGIEACKILKKHNPGVKVIGLTTYDQVSFISEMLRQGADGYLFKNTALDEIVAAVKSVHSGRQYLSVEVNQRLIQKATGRRVNKLFIPKLTRREKEVLDLIAQEFTNQEIADQLFITISTVETHRMNLCAKLNARNTAGLIKNAIKFGMI